MTAATVKGFDINGFWWAVLSAIVLSLMSFAISFFIDDKDVNLGKIASNHNKSRAELDKLGFLVIGGIMAIKLVALDLDDTLLDPNLRISEDVSEQFRRFVSGESG